MPCNPGWSSGWLVRSILTHTLRSMWSFWLTTFFHGTKRRTALFRNNIIFTRDNAPSHAARNSSASLAATGIKGEKMKQPPTLILMTYWKSLEHPQAKYVWGWAAVPIQTAALGGFSDILQRNLSRKSPKNPQVQRMQELWSCYQNRGSYGKNVTSPVVSGWNSFWFQ